MNAARNSFADFIEIIEGLFNSLRERNENLINIKCYLQISFHNLRSFSWTLRKGKSREGNKLERKKDNSITFANIRFHQFLGRQRCLRISIGRLLLGDAWDISKGLIYLLRDHEIMEFIFLETNTMKSGTKKFVPSFDCHEISF